MKKIMTVTMAVVFALTFGVAYAFADEYMTMSSDMSKSWDNGITIFAEGPVSTGISYRGGTGDLGMSEISAPLEASLALDNGVTLFNSHPVSTGEVYKIKEGVVSAEGAAAGGIAEEGPGLKLSNGITVFESGPVSTGINFRKAPVSLDEY